VQSLYYAVTIRAGTPHPAPGSLRHASDRRRIQLLVVGLYLAYTIFEADYEVARRARSFYADLNLPADAPDQQLKSHYRRLAARHHPDKLSSTDPAASEAAQAFFIHLKTAYDTLSDPARRFAYDRFGPDVLAWRGAATVRDFVSRGVIHGILPHYGLAAVAVYIMGWLGYLNFAQYYRWLLMAALCVLELVLVTRPAAPRALDALNAVLAAAWPAHGPFLQFQAIALARRLAVTVYVGLAQLGPLLQAELGVHRAGAAGSAEAADGIALADALGRLDAAAAAVDKEAERLWEMEMAPYEGDREVLQALRGRMAQWLVTNTIRVDPMVKDSLGSAFRRRRAVVSGERGRE
jgi:DnaJ-domain-containing protein 1